ncbi:AAA-domain-containing protein [Cylindrobasidium torrendii FP15055 ss-10]|uniref:Peroxisomal ATPase PEX1 n=1 Tax=Cylindrobasidium torrendii FP15055 ss-10 TaxID=1314674 RepID=A0A0D7B017_9AGAR|nr:AAA-domain-containing protein [Cylindrobasidium torrendii FP15055 ss-10]
MPRRARIHFVSLKSSLVNLPISIYGPLLERGVRPQGLAVHLSLVPPPGRPKKEAYVGWTGMASASSLASFNAGDAGESAGTVEIDPQYAMGLGFVQGDMVEIGLLHDLSYATSIGTEPVSSDDWEIIEIHASHVESTLLSQVRVASVGQEIDVWVLGRTRVRLTVVSLDPQNKGALLLTTNTEVSIAPKLHKRKQGQPSKPGPPQPTTSVAESQPPSQSTPAASSKHVLRVLPANVLSTPVPTHSEAESLAFVSPATLLKLGFSGEAGTFFKAQVKRIAPPVDPTKEKREDEEPVAKVLNPGEVAPPKTPGTVYVGSLPDIPTGHVVLPVAVADIEDWDLIGLATTADVVSIDLFVGAHTTLPSPKFLAGIDDVLTKCTEFCLKSFIVQSTKVNVRGVSSLLVTGRSGAGKTSIVKTVSSRLQRDPRIHAYIEYVDLAPYTEKPISVIKGLFKYWFDRAAFHKPSILILDNIEHLLKAEEENTDSFRTRQLVELFVHLFSSSPRSASPNARGIVLLATAPSASALHPLLNSKHVFTETVHVKAPNKDARRDILAQIVKERLSAAEDMDEDKETPLNYTYLATQTEGYSAIDLQDLVARATHVAAVRAATGESQPRLTQGDFETVQIDFVPLSLREVKMQKSDITWSDIGGLRDTKQVLRETLEWPTKYGPIFAQSPLRLRSGLLLYGYPGCGKTLLASAVAKECGLNFISVKGPEVLNKYIGASEKTVRDLFERASAAKPCVLFFDEFDSIAPKRGHDSTGVTDRVVNQMLTQMDGAEGLDGVYVLAATSRPDLIDSALLRPGRLDKSLLCNMPDVEERKDILLAVTRKVVLDPGVDLDEVAAATEGFSGADLQALVYNANLEAVHASINIDVSGSSARDEEDPIEFKTIGGPNAQAVSSKAEKMAMQKRLRLIQASIQRRPQLTQAASPSAPTKVEKKKHIILPEHLRNVLKTTRPSVPLDERHRLDRIYREFTSDRTGEMPAPPNGEGIGIRASLA